MIAPKTGVSKKKLIIYLLIIILMIVVNVAIYLGNSRSSAVPEAEIIGLDNLTAANPAIESQTASPKVSQSPLEHTLFNTLKKIGDWPVIPKNIGKSDPFAPFFSAP